MNMNGIIRLESGVSWAVLAALTVFYLAVSFIIRNGKMAGDHPKFKIA